MKRRPQLINVAVQLKISNKQTKDKLTADCSKCWEGKKKRGNAMSKVEPVLDRTVRELSLDWGSGF